MWRFDEQFDEMYFQNIEFKRIYLVSVISLIISSSHSPLFARPLGPALSLAYNANSQHPVLSRMGATRLTSQPGTSLSLVSVLFSPSIRKHCDFIARRVFTTTTTSFGVCVEQFV